eukprot:gene10184-biopygen12799
MQRDVFICFIDYSKAFDKVRHGDMFEELQKLDMHGKDLQLLQNLYWNQSACIRVDGECSHYTDIATGVGQGCVIREAWTLTVDLKKRLERCEMWFLRKMMRIPWTDKVSNEEVLARAGVNRRLINDIRMRQMRVLGHVLRKEGLELTGKIEGKRSRGRQIILWMNSLAGWIHTNGITIKETDLIHMTKNRELWQSMIAKVS